MRIDLPFPPAILSGHAKGNGQWKKIAATKEHRALAKDKAEGEAADCGYIAPDAGDIRIHFIFIPPDNRGDRLNFANRVKATADGVAEALGINDKRFLPSYEFRPAEKPGMLIVVIEEE